MNATAQSALSCRVLLVARVAAGPTHLGQGTRAGAMLQVQRGLGNPIRSGSEVREPPPPQGSARIVDWRSGKSPPPPPCCLCGSKISKPIKTSQNTWVEGMEGIASKHNTKTRVFGITLQRGCPGCGGDAGGTPGEHEIGRFQKTQTCNHFGGFGKRHALPGRPILRYHTKKHMMALWIATIHIPMSQHLR